MSTPTAVRRRAPSRAGHGRRASSTDWLDILDTDGPFLAAPVVRDMWPDGLPVLDATTMGALREISTEYDISIGAREPFVRHVLANTLSWKGNLAWGPEAARFAVTVPEHQTTVEITFALLGQTDDGAVEPDRPLLLGAVVAPGVSPTGRPLAGSGSWPASPADRLAHALRSRKVPLGLVTNGDLWTLVCAPAGGATSMATWTRHGWLEEAETLRAFAALLTRQRFLGVDPGETVPALLEASLARQEEVTERLSEQSQSVVEMLVATIGRIDASHLAEQGRPLLPAIVGPPEVYQAAVTVLMRLVFLLYAEERGLLQLDDDTYAASYAASTLGQQLRQRATESGEDTLERTSMGWHRLLALFRAVHRGSQHEMLRITAYGGGLFDPDRFPWLEGRADASTQLDGQYVPPIDDRTLLRALEALQTLTFTGRQGTERRRVSYRSLDVEQIGYVYEGLLDQDARRASEWVVSIAVSERDLRKDGPELALAELEEKHAQGAEVLAAWLAEKIKEMGANRSKASILKALAPLTGDALTDARRLIREAAGNDDAATDRLLPYARLLRLDPRDLPVVYPPGSLYLTDSEARSHTGAVYTPRLLAEQVVQGALEPLVYSPGPLDTEEALAWRLRRPEEILALKVCDIAVGSGAFLVAATRYLAQRLLESRAEYEQPGASTNLLPMSPDDVERAELAARRSVIDHCIYGVDINPMALEMAKLSLWLVTLDRNRPFSFLDDRLAVGDSLLGITSPDQLRDLHLDPRQGRRLHRETLDLFTGNTDRLLKEAAGLRNQLAQVDLRDSRDADHKTRLLAQADTVTASLSLVADGLSAASLSGGSDISYLELANKVNAAQDAQGLESLREYADFGLTRPDGNRHYPAHFPLLFPEVWAGGRHGFDAVVGNPPYLGGKRISGAYGTDYRDNLIRTRGRQRPGNTDLVAYMLLTGLDLLNGRGQLAIIATNTLTQGDTREVGLDQAVQEGLDIRASVKSAKWPTQAVNLQYCIVWGSRHARSAGVRAQADDTLVPLITPSLDASGRITGNPYRLTANRNLAYIGSYVLGLGFTMSPEKAAEMIALDPRNSEVLFPYVGGEDLNGRPNSSGKRWIVNFFDWSEERARSYPLPYNHVVQNVRPERMEKDAKRYPKMVNHWWRYWNERVELYRSLSPSTEL